MLGFDITALKSIGDALGYDARALLLLFHYAEQGLLQAVKHYGDSSQHAECLDPDSGYRR